eukprot:maker-scaffold928_size80290-snap-gene-0.13 protein:Tk06951 transcript:maker-scaffold928_size80290-snap-gene-0.13-mRNA-1 annotation:"pr domain zinc finger protein 15"
MESSDLDCSYAGEPFAGIPASEPALSQPIQCLSGQQYLPSEQAWTEHGPVCQGQACSRCGTVFQRRDFRSSPAFKSYFRQHSRICQDLIETDSEISEHASERSEVSSEAEVLETRADWERVHEDPEVCQLSDDDMPQDCENCGREFDVKDHFQDHMLACPKKYQCVMCDCPPLTWPLFQSHVLSHPEDEELPDIRPARSGRKRRLDSSDPEAAELADIILREVADLEAKE